MRSGASGDPQGPSFSEDADGLAPAAKKRRRSPRSIKTSSDVPDSGIIPNSTTKSGNGLDPNPQVMTTGEDEATHRSASPSDHAIRYTRTGRVSRATKGQRVHTCEDCGKIYTRAEHLRRHQQNHKPGTYLCDIPGCNRSFYRMDLLARHKERHDDPHDPPTRRASMNSKTSVSESGRFAAVLDAQTTPSSIDHHGIGPRPNPIQSSGLAPPTQAVPPTRDSRKNAPWELPLNPAFGIPLDITSGPQAEYPYGQLFGDSPPGSPTNYSSPTNEYSYTSGLPYFDQRSLPTTRHTSNLDGYRLRGYELLSASRSPGSAASSNPYVPSWSAQTGGVILQQRTSATSSESAFGEDTLGSLYSEHAIPVFEHGGMRIMLPEERDQREFRDLQIPNTIQSSPRDDFGLENGPFTNSTPYEESYWRWIHQVFPIIHKPTFRLETAPPLLRAAMLALGAHMYQTRNDMNAARIIHERCIKVLKNRAAHGWHTYRICDLQAIFLVEVYSIFKSRRPPLRLSKNFEDIFHLLAGDRDAVAPDTIAMFHDSPLETRQGPGTEPATLHLDVDAQTKRRLLLSCYMLDQQHALLFGRQPTECLMNSGNVSDHLHLPFLRRQQYWDASIEEQVEMLISDQTLYLPQHENLHDAITHTSLKSEHPEQPYDTTQSLLVLTAATDLGNDSLGLSSAIGDTLDPNCNLSVVEKSPRMRLAYHSLMLARHTPLRDLMAVAGESWVMAEKLSNADRYTAAQHAARDWAAGQSPSIFPLATSDTPLNSAVDHALTHALQILSIHMKTPKTGLLFQEWSLYLASIVIWARAYVSTSDPRRHKLRLSIPTPAEPKLPVSELDASVSALISAGPSAIASGGWPMARNVLLWTKTQIEKVDMPHNCGLTNGALDVLGKLVRRGSEEGWFA